MGKKDVDLRCVHNRTELVVPATCGEESYSCTLYLLCVLTDTWFSEPFQPSFAVIPWASRHARATVLDVSFLCPGFERVSTVQIR